MFPRPWLIALSIRLRPLLKFYFKGSRFIDPIDGSGYRKFLSYGYTSIRKNALCPGTLSLERHRLLWLYLTRETPLLDKNLTVLHVAPEQVFYDIFKRYDHWEYTTTDLHSPLAHVKADICSLPFENDAFDLILCNHVLEHIPDDRQAMTELFRVLKKGGTLIAQVPLDASRAKSFEDDTVTDSKERALLFGQYDHVRVYGKDFYARLEEVGFAVKAVNLLKKLSPEEISTYALPQNENIPVARK